MDEQVLRLQKSKAKILSSGKVVGDLGYWNIIKDHRCLGTNNYHSSPMLTNKFHALASEENTQVAYISRNNNANRNNYNVEINNVSQQIGEHESTKEWISMSFVIINLRGVVAQVKKNLMKHGLNVQPADQHVGDPNEVWDIVESKKDEQLCDDDNNNNKAVTIVPTIIQTDESLVVMTVETNIKVSKKGHTPTLSKFKEKQIFKDTDLSPRVVNVVKAARKGKKQGKICSLQAKWR
ncbi:hypothetical protein R3W88_016530 [Solanum pinnatisectum]|uniref:Uncharacterized protein n=1 Tax=Solanum pinnatisectum TaxID=50273 RepID=A0AAV9KXN1_9SOLN|nr:hypothetical protein R3W88_016530 [Solanum pinnatisectum]